MRLHAANGDSAGWLRTYRACERILQAELGAKPAPETRFLFRRPSTATALPPTPVRATQGPLPLVGRQREWQVLRAAWSGAVERKASCLLVSGEAGIGKTRLVEELVIWAGRQGLPTASARCYAAEGTLLYAPVNAWLHAPALRQRVQALESPWSLEVARLCPDLIPGDRSGPSRPTPPIES